MSDELKDGDTIPTTFTPLLRYTPVQRIDGTSPSTVKRSAPALYTPLYAGSQDDMTAEGVVGGTGITAQSQRVNFPLTFSIESLSQIYIHFYARVYFTPLFKSFSTIYSGLSASYEVIQPVSYNQDFTITVPQFSTTSIGRNYVTGVGFNSQGVPNTASYNAKFLGSGAGNSFNVKFHGIPIISPAIRDYWWVVSFDSGISFIAGAQSFNTAFGFSTIYEANGSNRGRTVATTLSGFNSEFPLFFNNSLFIPVGLLQGNSAGWLWTHPTQGNTTQTFLQVDAVFRTTTDSPIVAKVGSWVFT